MWMFICFACASSKSTLCAVVALNFSVAFASSCDIFLTSAAALLSACRNTSNAAMLVLLVAEYFLMASPSAFSSSSVLPTAFSLSFSKDFNSSLYCVIRAARSWMLGSLASILRFTVCITFVCDIPITLLGIRSHNIYTYNIDAAVCLCFLM